MKKQKGKLKEILECRYSYAKRIFQDQVNKVETPVFKERAEKSLMSQLDLAYEHIFEAEAEYENWKLYRENHPMTPDNETIIEILFKQRFGLNLFPVEREE